MINHPDIFPEGTDNHFVQKHSLHVALLFKLRPSQPITCLDRSGQDPIKQAHWNHTSSIRCPLGHAGSLFLLVFKSYLGGRWL